MPVFISITLGLRLINIFESTHTMSNGENHLLWRNENVTQLNRKQLLAGAEKEIESSILILGILSFFLTEMESMITFEATN